LNKRTVFIRTGAAGTSFAGFLPAGPGIFGTDNTEKNEQVCEYGHGTFSV
jgi:hypothetical protein